MGRHNNTGLHQLRVAFPKEAGWVVRGIGSQAAEVWHPLDYVGLISQDKTTGKWACTHNACMNDGDERFRFDSPKAAAYGYYSRFPDIAKPGTLAALQS